MARPRNPVDTNDLKQGQDQSFIMPATGSIDPDDFRDQFEIVENEQPKSALDAAAFYEEYVEVEIQTSENPNAEPVIQLQCNGINQFLFRGVKQKIRRKFVEILARAKTENLSTPEFRDANGNLATRINKSQGLKYPFRVIHDPNPMGYQWLENVMRQGA